MKDRLGDRPPALFTSDEHAAYETAIVTAFSEAEPAPEGPRRPGRPRVSPRRRPAAGLAYATVRKERKEGRVVSIRRTVVLGDERAVEEVLKASVCSRTINTSFVERRHATDRAQNARESRSLQLLPAGADAADQREDGRWRQRTPAMAAGLADHVWSLEE